MPRALAWFGGATERARAFKQSAGLAEGAADAGPVTPTILRVGSVPPGAAVLVDGMGMGVVTPHDLTDLPAGRPLEIELTLPGYRPGRQSVTLAPGEGLREVTLALARQVGVLVVRSEPPGAEVSVNGAKQDGVTPLRLEGQPAGLPLEVRVSARGRLPVSRAVLLTDGAEIAIDLELEIDRASIPPGRLAVASRAGRCEVLVDGQPVGLTPLAPVSLRAGAHEVRIRCPNHADDVRAVVLAPGKETRVDSDPEPTVFGYLTVVPVPASGVEVRINGERVPLPVESRKVIPGRHEVVVRDRNVERRLSVDVGPNARIIRTVDLYR